jgi:hypothetical protein
MARLPDFLPMWNKKEFFSSWWEFSSAAPNIFPVFIAIIFGKNEYKEG